jgi:hypothetical protein
MKHVFAVFVLLLGVFIASRAQTATPARPAGPLEQSLISAEKGFISAAKQHDREYFKRGLTEDYAFVGDDGQFHDRQEVLGERSAESLDLKPYNMKVIELSDKAAIVTYDVILHIPPSEDQGPPPRYQHWTSVWTRQGDQWKLKFQQSTPTHWGDW